MRYNINLAKSVKKTTRDLNNVKKLILAFILGFLPAVVGFKYSTENMAIQTELVKYKVEQKVIKDKYVNNTKKLDDYEKFVASGSQSALEKEKLKELAINEVLQRYKNGNHQHTNDYLRLMSEITPDSLKIESLKIGAKKIKIDGRVLDEKSLNMFMLSLKKSKVIDDGAMGTNIKKIDGEYLFSFEGTLIGKVFNNNLINQ